MKAIISSIFACCLCFSALSQERQIKAESKIVSVTVFINGAEIRRVSSVDIPAGISQIVFSGLSPEIEPQSIQAKGEGNFTILSLNRQNNFLEEQKYTQEVLDLNTKIESIQDVIAQQQNQIAVLKSEEEMLIKNQVVSGNTTGLDLAKLKAALDFHRLRLAEAKNQQLVIQQRITKNQESLNSLRKQLNELRSKSRNTTSDIVVKVSSKVALRSGFTLSYLVKNANWYPTYDLRAKDISSPIDLVYKANVSQRTGEDWKDVKLILSSGDPSVGGVKPELQPYFIGYNIVNSRFQGAINGVQGTVRDSHDGQPLIGVSVGLKGTTIGTVSDVNGNYSLQLPANASTLQFRYIGYKSLDLQVTSATLDASLEPAAQVLEEVVIVGYGGSNKNESGVPGANKQIRIRGLSSLTTPVHVESRENQTNIQFSIQNPYTILSDGKQFTVDIGQYQIPATYQYYSVPKLKPDVFLNASIVDYNEVNLLSGEANIFFEGTFLGKTIIDVQNSSDTLNISLGVDKNVIVTREKQKSFNDKQLLGSSQRANRGFVIDLKNRKSQFVNLIIEDQIPVSNTGEVTVEKDEFSGGKLDETNGKVTWSLKLQPNEQKKLELKYKVKYPKNKTVNLE
ncbi:MAG: mucoidy inhibitor MuiA family protein [Sphingobacteriaceae bacterium]|nr:mucoidy inhibitor MuiA family protein [Sphingobacteriaceae bacterium]